MTKGKLILSGVALFAVIGGALAFKAARTPAQFFSAPVGQIAPCNVPVVLQATFTAGASNTRLSVAPTNATCPLTRTVFSVQ
jgi:hypothetical protein